MAQTEQPKPQSMGCLVAPVAIIIYGILGFLLLWQFGGKIVNYVNTMDWQQVEGTVTSRSVEDGSDLTGEHYNATISYTYEVDGEMYEGNTLDLRGVINVGNRDDAEALIAPYPVGASVMPYVDMTNPTRSVLTRDIQTGIWVLSGIGGFLALLSIILGIRYMGSRSQPNIA